MLDKEDLRGEFLLLYEGSFMTTTFLTLEVFKERQAALITFVNIHFDAKSNASLQSCSCLLL